MIYLMRRSSINGDRLEDNINNSSNSIYNNGNMCMINRREFIKGAMASSILAMVPLDSMFLPDVIILDDCVFFLHNQLITVEDDGTHIYSALVNKIGGHSEDDSHYVAFQFDRNKYSTVEEVRLAFTGDIIKHLRLILEHKRYNRV